MFDKPNLLSITTIAVLLVGCGGSSSSTLQKETINGNSAPTISLFSTDSVIENKHTTINSNVEDSDGTVVSYLWSQTGGQPVNVDTWALSELNFQTPLVNADTKSDVITINDSTPETTTIDGEVLTFELTVMDDDNAISVESISIIVTNNPALPNVALGEDFSVNEQTETTIISSTSLDEGELSYSWELINSNLISLEVSDSEDLTFISPNVENDTLLTFQLTATSSAGLSQSDIVDVLVTNITIVPQVNAGMDLNVSEGDLVSLFGTSSDSDGYVVAYSWDQISGTNVTLNNPLTPTPSFIAPETDVTLIATFELTVTDNADNRSTDEVVVNINPKRSILLNDTGYEQCLDLASESLGACDNDTYPSQDGDFGRDFENEDLLKIGSGLAGFDFTKMSTSGIPLSNTADEWACVLDNNTGLMWEVKSESDPLTAATNTYSLDEANQYVISINNTSACAHDDWRLPTFVELQGIVNFSNRDGEIDPVFFPFIKNSTFLTSTVGASVGETIMTINIENHKQLPSSTANYHNIILVRK